MLHVFLNHDVDAIAPWFHTIYLPAVHTTTAGFRHTEYWIKSAKYNVYDMAEELVGTPRLPVSAPAPEDRYNAAGIPGTDQRADTWIDAIAGRSAGNKLSAIAYYHPPFDEKFETGTQKSINVSFNDVAVGNYFVEVYRIDTSRGSAWEILSEDRDIETEYRQYYIDSDSNLEPDWHSIPNLPIDPAVDLADIRAYQRQDEYHLVSTRSVTVSSPGSIVEPLTMNVHEVYLVVVTPKVAYPISKPPLDLSFQKNLRGATGELPSTATGISYERGVEPGAVAGDPGDSWAEFNTTTHRKGNGSEEHRAARFEAGSRLAYTTHPMRGAEGSVVLWARSNWNGDGGTTADHALVSWAPDPGDDEFRLWVEDESSLSARWIIGGTPYEAELQFPTDLDWNADEWHRVEVKWFLHALGFYQCDLKVDSLPTESIALPLGSLPTNATAPLYIGGVQNGTMVPQHPWEGVIDVVVVKRTL